MIKFSIIIPAYNEEGAIKETVGNLKKFLAGKYQDSDYEIIVVNDGSTDKTGEILRKIDGINLIDRKNNKGYGASIKDGVKESKYDWILFYDADGQHNPDYIPELIKKAEEENADMVIGKRTGYQGPSIRQPGKRILKWVAEYLAEQKIPDINSGFRIIKKEYFNQFKHLFPNGFSISTTSTMAFLNAGLNISYMPIEVNKRIGKSTVKARHAVSTMLLIFRIIMLFNPLKIFFPISFIAGLLTFIFLVWDIILFNISGTTIILFLTTIMVFCFGLLADQISSIRRG
jgi:glycosyltransferase involved in cell wall biosynthesis